VTMVIKSLRVWSPRAHLWAVASAILLVVVLGVVIQVIWVPPEHMLDAAFQGYQVVSPPQNYVEAALQYESADPEADARGAVARGDRRLWAVGEGDSLILGVDPHLFGWYTNHFKVRTMYLSDVIHSEDQARFQKAFYLYTERYNSTVVALSKQ